MNYSDEMKKVENLFREAEKKYSKKNSNLFGINGSTAIDMKNRCMSLITSNFNIVYGGFEDKFLDLRNSEIDAFNVLAYCDRGSTDYCDVSRLDLLIKEA